MKKIFVLCLISLIPNVGSTTAMSEEKSRCLDKEATAKTYYAWKASFQQFLLTYRNLNEYDKLLVSRRALQKITNLTKTFASETRLRAPDAMIADTTRFLDDPQMGGLTPNAAIELMKTALIKFENSMDNMVFTAQSKYLNCDLVPSSRNSDHTAAPRKAE